MSNPYASPTPPQPGMPGHPYHQPGFKSGSGFVPQVRIVAILMQVLGGLELAIGLAGITFGIVFLAIAPPNTEPEEAMFVGIFYMAFGVFYLPIAGLRIYAGICNYRYRGHTLGIVSHFAGLLTLVNCYCMMFTLGICIYGCIVYFQPSVQEAFSMRKKGNTTDQILAHFRQAAGPW